MGSLCTGQQIRKHQVTYLQNQAPNSQTYRQFNAKSIRFDDITLIRKQKNIYAFTLQVKQQGQVIVQIPVLNQKIHSITCQNYHLKLQHKMIIDIFNQDSNQFNDPQLQNVNRNQRPKGLGTGFHDLFASQYSTTLMNCQNQRTNIQYSMKIYPFKGYQSYIFKRGLYQIWLHRKLQKKNANSKQHVLKLVDAYVFGVSQSRQALVFIFSRAVTSLANIAQYRLKSNWFWKPQEKYAIILNLLTSYGLLYKSHVYHRNIRPSNIFFSDQNKKFVIGNLACAKHYLISQSRYVYNEMDNEKILDDDDLMTVCGVPFFVDQKVKQLIHNNQQIGLYNGIKADYQGILSIVNILQTCNIFDRKVDFKDQSLKKLSRMLNQGQDFDKILNVMIDQGKRLNYSADISILTNDRQIAKTTTYLLSHTHKQKISDNIFQTCYNLGFDKQFSDMAHLRLDQNIQNRRQLDNAYILKRLAQFYEESGGNGTQYYYNSFVLFVKRSEKQLKYGHIDKAQQQIQQAKNVFLSMNRKLQTKNAKLQLDRVRSLIMLARRKKEEAMQIIQATIVIGAKQQLQLQSQAKLLHTFAKILRKNKRKQQAQERIKYGLGICGNVAQFKSPSSCRIHKSHFLHQLGSLYMDQIVYKHNPHKHSDQQIYSQQLRGKAQSNLKAALQILQQQRCDDIDVAQCLLELGQLYYLDQDFFEAKRAYRRGLIRLKNLSPQISPYKIAQASYSYGSCCYYLKQYEDAKKSFQDSIQILQKIPNQYLLKWNVEGNLGLAMIRLGMGRQAVSIFNQAVDKIKRQEGDKSYDYASLMKEYMNIGEQ